MELNERIFIELKMQRKTAKELSRSLELNPASVSAWKTEGSYPSSKHVIGISKFLNVNVEWLLTGEGEKIPQPKNAVSPWEIQEYQRQVIKKYFENLTDDQAMLLDNYGKLTPSNQMEVQSIITMKIAMQSMGRSEFESGTA